MIWSYAGVRSLYDDGEAEAKDVTRDYHLELDPAPGPKLLSVFGGKITTARQLAAEALDMLGVGGPQVHRHQLRFPAAISARPSTPGSRRSAPGCPRRSAAPARRAYGTRLKAMLGDAESLADLGRHFGAGLYEARCAI